MGMSAFSTLLRVELPLALRVIIAGVPHRAGTHRRHRRPSRRSPGPVGWES